MIRKLVIFFTLSGLLASCGISPAKSQNDNCPVTSPTQQATELPTNTDYQGNFWYGTPDLWTNLPEDGTWWGLPKGEYGYVQKAVFWREDYIASEEPNPELIVSGRRLDASAQTFSYSDATHGWDDSGDFMLMGINIPAEGCWEITAEYQETQLTYVVKVKEER